MFCNNGFGRRKLQNIVYEIAGSWETFCGEEEEHEGSKKGGKGGKGKPRPSYFENILGSQSLPAFSSKTYSREAIMAQKAQSGSSGMTLYYSLVGCFGIVVGAFAAKVYKSRSQFEGLSMESAHSSI